MNINREIVLCIVKEFLCFQNETVWDTYGGQLKDKTLKMDCTNEACCFKLAKNIFSNFSHFNWTIIDITIEFGRSIHFDHHLLFKDFKNPSRFLFGIIRVRSTGKTLLHFLVEASKSAIKHTIKTSWRLLCFPGSNNIWKIKKDGFYSKILL